MTNPETVHIIGSKTLGGAERFFLRLAEALRDHGAPVRVFLRRKSAVVPQVPEGIPVTTLPFRTVWDPFSKIAVSRTLARLRPQVVQTYMGRATRLTRIPKGRGMVHVARLGGYYKLDGYHHAHAWIGNTRGVCDYLIQGGMPAGRVYHIGNFIDPPRPVSQERLSALRSSLGLPKDAVVLVTAGRFMEVKGHADLLKAMSLLSKEIHGRRVYLVMVGEGPLGPGLKRLAGELGLGDRVIWTGWQVEPEPYLSLADLVVFPSLEMETLGNLILEAWNLSKPLVVTRFRGAREITHHGEDAWQIPCADPRALARGIETVLRDEALAQGLADSGNRRIQRDFTRKAVVERYLSLYAELLRREA